MKTTQPKQSKEKGKARMVNTHNRTKKRRGMPAQRLFNRFVIWLLQSPFHRVLSTHLLLLTYTGKQSGTKRSVPITYLQEGEMVTAFCERDVIWWKNLRGDAPVTVRLRGRDVAGIATPVTNDPEAMTPTFLAFLQKNRQAGGFNAVPFDTDGQPNKEALDRSIQTKVMVRIQLA